MHVSVSGLKGRLAWFGRLVDGTPVIIYERRERHSDRMRNLRMRESDVTAGVRQKGLMRLEQVRHAVVERDGKISIIPDEEDRGGNPFAAGTVTAAGGRVAAMSLPLQAP